MLDQTLVGYVEAESEDQADRHLERLLEARVRPLIRTIVARKLGGYGASAPGAQDLEDVAGDAIVTLVRRLQELRALPDAGEVNDLDAYTATVAYSACAHYLRRKYPERSRLKNRLRYVLARDPRFASWHAGEHDLVCGLARWRGERADRDAAAKLSDLERHPDRWPRSWTPPRSMDRADPSRLAAQILETAGGAVEFDQLLRLIARIWQVDRGQASGAAPAPAIPTHPSPEDAIDRRRLLERLWAEVQQLPVRQRIALLLNLRDVGGAGLLWILPVMGLASMRAVAAALEMSVDDLAGLWNRLPLDDHAIAARLGCTRQQVINLRMSARKRLSNRLKPSEAPGPGMTARPANLPGLSASMGSDT